MDNNSKNYFAQTWQLINSLAHSKPEQDAFIRELSSPGNISKIYRGIPIKRHFSILGSVDPEFKKFTTLDTAGNQTTVRSISKLSAENILETLLSFYADDIAVAELTKKAAIETHLLSDEEKKEPEREVDEDKKIDDRDKKIKEKEQQSKEETIKGAETKFKQENPSLRSEIESSKIPVGSLNNFNTGSRANAASAVLNSTQTGITNTARNVASSAQIGARNIGGDLARGAKSWVGEAVSGITGNTSSIASPASFEASEPVTTGVSSVYRDAFKSTPESFEAREPIVSPVPAYARREKLETRPSFEADEPIKTAVPDYVYRDSEDRRDQREQSGQRTSRREIQDLQREFRNQPDLPQSTNIPRRGLNFNRNIQMPEAMKDFGSSSQIRMSQGIRAVGQGGKSFLGDLGGGLARTFGFGGGSAAAGAGTAAGAGGVAAAGGTAAAGGAVAAAAPAVAIGVGVVLIIIIAILLFFAIFWFINYITETNAYFPPYEQTAVGQPGASPGTGVGNISSCTFIRSQDNPPGLKYQSQQLVNYFEEASSKTGIPVKVLAAFVRVEYPAAVSMNDSQINSLGCIENPSSGALGIMQLIPQGRTGYAEDAINNGARLIGKSAGTITREDLCNVQKNVLVGAGFILKKMQGLGYGDGSSWNQSWTSDRNAINALVRSYYGGLLYGPNDQFNYGDDVWNSVSSCMESTNPDPSPDPNPPPAGDFVFYCQSGGSWGNQCVINKANCEKAVWGTPPTKCTYGQAACGPTSFAMVASSLGVTMNPVQAATQFVNNGTFTCEIGTTGMLSVYGTQFFKDKFIAGPDVVSGGSLNMQKAKETFDAGYKYIIGSAGQFPLVSGGRFDHIFVVESIDISKNEVVVRDPAKCNDDGIRRFKPNEFNWKYAHGIKLK